MRELFDATYLTHGLLPFPQSRGRDLHLILLIWGGGRDKGEDGDLCMAPDPLEVVKAHLPYLER